MQYYCIVLSTVYEHVFSALRVLLSYCTYMFLHANVHTYMQLIYIGSIYSVYLRRPIVFAADICYNLCLLRMNVHCV